MVMGTTNHLSQYANLWLVTPLSYSTMNRSPLHIMSEIQIALTSFWGAKYNPTPQTLPLMTNSAYNICTWYWHVLEFFYSTFSYRIKFLNFGLGHQLSLYHVAFSGADLFWLRSLGEFHARVSGVLTKLCQMSSNLKSLQNCVPYLLWACPLADISGTCIPDRVAPLTFSEHAHS